MRAFGNPTSLKEETRDTWGWVCLGQIGQDLRLGLRMRKNPGFTSTVILTLGLGIGMNSANFTVANGFLLREPPVTDPPTVVMLFSGSLRNLLAVNAGFLQKGIIITDLDLFRRLNVPYAARVALFSILHLKAKS
jgi:hypothetical protein